MDQDELIYQVKLYIMDYYNIAKFDIEIDCQEVLEEMSEANQDSKTALKKFEELLQINDGVDRQTMNKFNEFLVNLENIANKSKDELIQMFIKSTFYIIRKDILIVEDDEIVDENKVGSFFQFNWFLNKKQLDYIKVIRLKDELKKDIEFCLDEV